MFQIGHECIKLTVAFILLTLALRFKVTKTKMQPQQTVSKEWLQKTYDEDKKRREENSKYVQLQTGENIINVDLTQIPIETKTKQGYPRYVWQTLNEKNGNKLLLSTSPTLNGFIVEALLADINPFTLIKVGQGINTRYSIKELGR